MAILVTGGAGYIGGTVARSFLNMGEEVVVLDDFSKSLPASVPDGCAFYEGRSDKGELIAKIAKKHKISACLHFAAFIEAGESVKYPYKYFYNNTASSLGLFHALIDAGVKKIVFSSTAAVYGEPKYTPIDENHPKNPTNPYGLSKLFTEKILETFSASYGIKYAALRYFNACGSDGTGNGEDHRPETHLIPLVLQVAQGIRKRIFIFGDDYPTPDGTCVRDYIHVSDLASAHLAAYDYLISGAPSVSLNLGNGSGFSVKEVIETARKITGHPIPAETVQRRPGDPSVLVASSEKAGKILGWKPERRSLDEMVASAWEWHKNNPNGYGV